MNLLHLKYAVVVAETGSISKASERLYVGQPNLSRAIKELENSLGVMLFDRSAKGMFLTSDGELFVRYAKLLLNQVDEIEAIFKSDKENKRRFSISVPCADYIANAFARFSTLLTDNDEVEVFYQETSSQRVIRNILQEGYKLGIIRYAEEFDKYYHDTLDDKGISYELVAEFRFVLLMNEECPLSKLNEITYDDLSGYTEVILSDSAVASLPMAQANKEEISDGTQKHIYVFERGSLMEILSQNKKCYCRTSPVSESVIKKYNIIQRHYTGNSQIYKDVLIHRKDYCLSELDKLFVGELVRAKREMIDDCSLSFCPALAKAHQAATV